MTIEIRYQKMSEHDFPAIIVLATEVHGNGYVDEQSIKEWFNRGIKNGINASYVAYHEDKLVGFRMTYAAEQWEIDEWCSPELWQFSPSEVSYFKCNTVDENYRGHAIGGKLLYHSIAALKQQGAKAGVSHLWMQSPGNSAVRYFTKCGGKLIKVHPDRWHEMSTQGYDCPICHHDCHCSAAEMLIDFSEVSR